MTDRSIKVSELPVHMNAPADNLLPIVANPATANAVTRKISLQNLFANVSTPVRINSTLRATGNTTFNGNINVDGDIIGTGNVALIAGQDSSAILVSNDNEMQFYVNTTAAYVRTGDHAPFEFSGGELTFPSNTTLNTITLNRGVIESNLNDGLTITSTEAGSGQYVEIAYIDTNNANKNSSILLANGVIEMFAGGYELVSRSNGSLNYTGTLIADKFSGNGALIASIDANNITSGTLATARLPATANISTAVNVGGNLHINTSSINIGNSTANATMSAEGFVGVGEFITYINASNITDGTLATELLPATINVATAFNISDQVAINSTSFSIINGSNSAQVNTTGVYIGGRMLKDTANLTVTDTTIASNTNVVITSNNGASTWTFGADGDLTIPDGKTIRLFSGDPALTPIGPFANDAVAAEYGVLLGNMYYTADGVVHIRLV